MRNWFPTSENFPDILYDQEDNLYYETRGPVASMARREYPASYPLSESVPIDWYDFQQEEFTYGETDKEVSEVWNLNGDRFEVENISGILYHEGSPIQKQGIIELSYPEGYFEPLQYSAEIENGPIWIGGVWYRLTDGLLDRPLDSEVTSSTEYVCFGSVYCFVPVNTQDLDLPFPGVEWTIRPVSYILPEAAGAYANLFNNSWYVPIPFPKTTTVTDTDEPVANGFDMRQELTKMYYSGRWSRTFPMPHKIDNALQYSIVRTNPLIACLRYNYRLAVDRW